MSCNGSGLQETLSKNHGYETQESTLSSKRKADVEKWAALLAAGMVQANTNVALLGPGSAPEAWRSDVEPMTPAAEAETNTDITNPIQGPREQTAATLASDTEHNRVQVRVNVGEFGELALVVERSAEGVNIRIAAQDNGILEAMAAEKETLAAALTEIGHSVTSLAFVAMDRVGIDLAQPRTKSSSNTRTHRNDKNGNFETPQQKRKSRRLNVIG